MDRRIYNTALTLLSCYCTLHVTAHYLVDIKLGSGPSMYPTYPVGTSSNIISRLHRLGRGVRVGDIVNAENPAFAHQHFAKRIIGMPGDFVVKDPSASPSVGGADVPGIVGDDEREPDNSRPRRREEPVMIEVPEGHVWVVGDNLSWSRDSRFYGPVPMALIRGKVLAVGDGYFSWEWVGGNHLHAPPPDDEAD